MKIKTVTLQLNVAQFEKLQKNSKANDISEVTVPVYYVSGGGKIHIRIRTLLEYQKNDKGVLLNCFTVINKPLRISLILGLILPFSALLAGLYFLYLVLSILFSSLIFGLILNRTIWMTKDYIISLCQD